MHTIDFVVIAVTVLLGIAGIVLLVLGPRNPEPRRWPRIELPTTPEPRGLDDAYWAGDLCGRDFYGF